MRLMTDSVQFKSITILGCFGFDPFFKAITLKDDNMRLTFKKSKRYGQCEPIISKLAMD
jgi:hypothetical protein